MSRRIRIALLLVTLSALAAPVPALASADLEIGIEDERIMLDDFHEAPAAVAAWKDLGIQAVRLHARWGRLAPSPGAKRRPSGFTGADQADPRYHWGELDRAVNLLRAAGLKISLTVTGPGPLWSSSAPARREPGFKPNPKAYGAFARAVATRYRGQIERYLIWNEPNISGWLAPQSSCRGRGRRMVCTPVSPHIYRSLVRAAGPAIRAIDPGAEVLIGELAPIGNAPHSDRTTMAPLPWYRALGCVDGRFRPIRTGLCRGFKPASADGIGHHPHGVFQAPDQASKDPNWAKMGDLARFQKTLDRLARARRIKAPRNRLDLYLTEFGYQTSPPDHATGIPVARQASWLQQAAYLSWRNPRVRSLILYQWADEPVRYRGPRSLAYAGWQSGLLYADGRPKPALKGIATPLVIDRRAGSGKASVWGQVRADGVSSVTIQRRVAGGFSSVATVPTDAQGFWTTTMSVVPGDAIRALWSDPAQPYAIPTSGTAVVGTGKKARLTTAG
jgi:hypothetical protein